MGWTTYARWNSPKDRDAERAELIRIFTTYSAAPFTVTCLMASKVGRAWYLAIRLVPNPGETLPESHHRGYVRDAEGAITFAAVALTDRKDGEWGYKDLCESMGPFEAEAPMRLIALLSPLVAGEMECAAAWRSNVSVHHARRRGGLKICPGDRIVLDRSLYFRGFPPFTARQFEAFTHRAPGRKRARTLYRTLDTPTQHIVTIPLKTLAAGNARPIGTKIEAEEDRVAAKV